MWDWIVIGVLYAVGIGFFHLLGGLNSAAEAFQRWGHASAMKRRHRLPTPRR
jgi:hypothetical protein